MMILAAQNIVVQIQQKEILHQVSLALKQGKRTAIIGPNGSGKSTLLKVLAGLLTPTQGTVLFEDIPLGKIGKRKLAQKIAVLPQGMTSPPDLTVRELVYYGRFPYRSWWQQNDKRDQEAVEQALAATGMTRFEQRLLTTLSGGERQRAWIAMALAQEPKALLLDEPTTYLDIAHQLEVMQIISRLNKTRDISIVMVLHDLNHALQYADEVIVVKNGAIFAMGTPQDILQPPVIAEVFGVEVEMFSSRQGNTVLSPIALPAGEDSTLL